MQTPRYQTEIKEVISPKIKYDLVAEAGSRLINDKEKAMSKCKDCTQYFALPENAGDYEKGKGDCVKEKQDAKGKYWLSKPTTVDTLACNEFKAVN